MKMNVLQILDLEKNDIHQLKELFQIPENIFCYIGTKVDAIEALCIFFETVCISNKIW